MIYTCNDDISKANLYLFFIDTVCECQWSTYIIEGNGHRDKISQIRLYQIQELVRVKGGFFENIKQRFSTCIFLCSVEQSELGT